MPFNATKPSEYAPADPTEPPEGAHEDMPSPATGASTLSEKNESPKSGAATLEPQSLDGSQATLFFDSQTPQEQAHIIGGFRFELSKVTVPAIRERMVSSLRNVSQILAAAVAEGLGIELPEPMPRAIKRIPKPEIKASKALSLLALPGDGGIATRKIAILIANGIEGESITAVMDALNEAGAVTRLLGSRLGTVASEGGEAFLVDATLENSPSVLFDALVLPDGTEAVESVARDGHTLEFLKDQYRHCKAILALGASSMLLEKAGISPQLPTGAEDPGLIVAASSEAWDPQVFIAAVAQHRHPARDSDPPLV
jgi:catalase